MDDTEYPTGAGAIAERPNIGRNALDGAVRLARLRARMFARIEHPKIGTFNVLRSIGAGGMGVVYAAWDPDLDRLVAIKVLRETNSPAAAERLQREAVALARLRNPNVVNVHAVGMHEGQVYLAMEYVDGQTLRSWMTAWRNAPQRDYAELAAVFEQSARGLAAAHDAGLVHRDFKPENVMIGADGRVRLMDFGLARASATVDEMKTWTADDNDEASGDAPGHSRGSQPDRREPNAATSTMFGTPRYMAPEQFVGTSIGPAADQYAFMLALLEALTGRLFGEGRNRAALAFRRLNVAPDLRRDFNVPRRVRALLQRGLSPEAEARWGSMHEVADEIRRVLMPRRVRGLGLTIGMLGLATGAAAMIASRDPACQDAEARLGEAWDSTRRQAATARLGSGAAATRIAELLDQYAERWQAAHHDACAATRIAGSQSEAMLQLRMRCLSRARGELNAATEALAALEGTAANVQRAAVQLHARLPEIGHCADLERLTSDRLEPSDPTQVAQTEAIRAQLAAARVRGSAGADTLPELASLRRRADAVGFGPLQAEVAFEQAHTLDGRKRQPEIVYDAMLSALDLAESWGHDAIAMAGWQMLVLWAGHQGRDPKTVDLFARRATAAWKRVGSDPVQHANLERHIGAAWRALGDLDRARPHLSHALELFDAQDGAAQPRYGHALVSMGNLHWDAEEFPQARALFEAAVEHGERIYGPEHPELLAALLGLSGVLGVMDSAPELQRAAQLLQRAEDIVDMAALQDSETGLHIIRQRLQLEYYAGRADNAVGVARKAHAAAIARGAPPTSINELAMMHGRTLHNAERCPEAIAPLSEAVEGAQRLGDSTVELNARLVRAACLELATPAEAIPDANWVLAELERRGESKTGFYARALLTSAAAHRAVDNTTALQQVQRAREILGPHTDKADFVNEIEAQIRDEAAGIVTTP